MDVVVIACLFGLVLGLTLGAISTGPRFRLWQLLGIVALVASLLGLGRVAVQIPREAAVASSCHGRLFKIALALDDYRAQTGAYPPRSLPAASGRTTRWSDLLAQDSSYGYTNGDEFLAEMFRCPGGSRYLLVVGPRTAVQDQPVAAASIRDGLANTLLAIEAADQLVERYELTLQDIESRLSRDGTFRPTHIHPSGRGLVFADGAIYRLARPLSLEQLRALMTIDGGEAVTRDRLEGEGYLVSLSGPRH